MFPYRSSYPFQGYGHSPFTHHYVPPSQRYQYTPSLEEEERATLAHLHDIQRRREEEQIAIREAARRQVEKEIAYRQAIQEAYVERQRAEQLEREKAIAREVAARRLVAERERQIAEYRERRAAYQAAQKERYEAFIAEKKRRWVEHLKAQQARSAYAGQQQCARRCAGPCAVRSQEKPNQVDDEKTEQKEVNELDELNKWLGLFGIRVVNGDAQEEKGEQKDAVKEKKVGFAAETVKEPEIAKTVPAAAVAATESTAKSESTVPTAVNETTETPKETAKPASTASQSDATTDQPKPFEFGQDLNDLIYNFFGVKLEPAKEGEKPTTPGVPASLDGLNNFLSQFGVFFEPEEQEAQRKGKGVAPGEKTEKSKPAKEVPVAATKEVPTPAESTTSTSSTESIAKLDNISHELDLVRESFTFPAKLSFSESSTPTLLFNKTNSSYHAQANKLLQLLLAADGITSGGDKAVRNKRKEVVRNVEAEIESLEKKRDEVFENTQHKRANGEVESEDEGWGSASSAASDAGVNEIQEQPAATNAEGINPQEEEKPSSETTHQGYELTYTENAEQSKNDRLDSEETTETEPLLPEETVDENVKHKEKEKDDEYELL